MKIINQHQGLILIYIEELDSQSFESETTTRIDTGTHVPVNL